MSSPKSFLRGSTAALLALFALFLLSGATSLVYEVIWLRKLILIFGSTQFATSTILSTFMGGLALGAFLAGRWYRSPTRSPLQIYGWLEIGIGLYALGVPWMFDALRPVYRAIWAAGASESFLVLSLAKFVGIALVLLPPTVLMGASLPVLARQVADDPARIGGKVGTLYAINVFGAVAGVFVAGIVAVPTVGVTATIWITAAVNVALGLVAILLGRRVAAPALADEDSAGASRPRISARGRLVLVVFGLSGFGALVLEVAWTRVLALIVGSSVYAFSLMLLAFLIGLAVGGVAISAFLRRRPQTDPGLLLAALLIGSGMMAFGSARLFEHLPHLFTVLFQMMQPGPRGAFLIQFVISLLVMFPTTFALGGIFPAVLQLYARRLDQVSGSVGTVYASNTLGTILGAGVAGFVLIPGLGMLNTVLAVAVLQTLLGLAVAIGLTRGASRSKTLVVVVSATAVILMLVMRPAWDVLVMNSGPFYMYGTEGRSWEEYRAGTEEIELVYAAEGLTASVIVVDEPRRDNRYLSVNGKIEASSLADIETQLMAAHLPLLIHEDPKEILIIGLASGITVGSAATHPLESIRVVEIEKTMIGAARTFREFNNDILEDPRLTISVNDARNELEFSPATYDIIMSEPSNPWMTIASNLFTEEFFRMAKRRVRPGGIFAQWVQNYYLSVVDLKSIISAFHASFPYVLMFETLDGVDLHLIGSDRPLRLNREQIEQRIAELSVRMDLARIDVDEAMDVISAFRLGEREIRELTAGAARNTDDNARVEFSAPKSLGLYTLGDNIRVLRRFAANPLDYVEPVITDAQERDRFRLEIAEAWLRRGEYDLARSTADQVSDGPLRARAEEILSELESRASGT